MSGLDFAAAVADRGFDVSLTVRQGETVAVLGPNGAGKSTLLGLVAGLVRPDSGRATLDGDVLFDTPAVGRGRFAPPHDRGVSLLAQDALLFPHLSVLDNVAFGPRSAGLPRADALRRARAWLERVDAEELASRRPASLSGGQAQRIAVARALAAEPALLLLDEPMAALDVSVAPALRRMLREVLADQTTIIVTHDVLDAFTLADRVVVMSDGRVVDSGPVREVLDRPRTTFAANLSGVLLLTGLRAADGVALDGGGELRVPGAASVAIGGRVGIAVRPPHVRVETQQFGTRGAGVRERIVDFEPRGDLVRVHSARMAADLPPSVVAGLALAEGDEVSFVVDPALVSVYPL
ncbi:sulfate/molybdate ABC transporter ATP-binding protein [Herbiconiux sp. L3-i23]|uniref:sulfate/molybdate ABC transporter ATP-binding protein n=1 Tax=Herbiconiux sp. L3-i23 TaxID=2905871 RepID=UPI00206CEAA2|nr:ATP-binding cassette domain-containing protein [Herbiconiux sp. L3-i23]BDI21856.1 molybdenum ABC transporter ATP-binding protein [Herbiconiux sp. L3-i23]